MTIKLCSQCTEVTATLLASREPTFQIMLQSKYGNQQKGPENNARAMGTKAKKIRNKQSVRKVNVKKYLSKILDVEKEIIGESIRYY